MKYENIFPGRELNPGPHAWYTTSLALSHAHILVKSYCMNNKWLMAKKSLNMMEKMMVPNMNDYYIIYCAIPSIIAIENRYQIDFGKPVHVTL